MSKFMPSTPFDAIIFDCDGTLSCVEGIDVLATQKGVGDEVKILTAQAMGESGLTPALYQTRLDLVAPNLNDVKHLGKIYLDNQVEAAQTVIHTFSLLKKNIYLVSAGVNPAVALFGKALGIPEQNIFAVDLFFDERGQFLHFDHHSPLVHNDGKRTIVSHLKKQHNNLLYVGDGLNDLVVYDLVDRFVGFGGVFDRPHIAEQCEFYLSTPSLSSLLKFALTSEEYDLFMNR